MNQNITDAKKAGLHYCAANSEAPGFKRIAHGKNFKYQNQKGKTIRDEKILARIRKLAIPPAYREVWIAADPKSHLQYVGTDARGRKQYRYHADWTALKANAKYNRVLEFGRALPRIRKITQAHLRRHELSKEKVLATAVRLLETTLIRIGNEEYAKSNQSYGLVTLKNKHVTVKNKKVIFNFKGKSNVQHEISVNDARLATILKQCQELPGQKLFEYLDAKGEIHCIHSTDVNAYLKEITGRDFTAKDFRTWGACLFSIAALREMKVCEKVMQAKRNVNQALDRVAARLGNTRTICRKSYVHPAILDAYLDGTVVGSAQGNDERALLSFLKKHS